MFFLKDEKDQIFVILCQGTIHTPSLDERKVYKLQVFFKRIGFKFSMVQSNNMSQSLSKRIFSSLTWMNIITVVFYLLWLGTRFLNLYMGSHLYRIEYINHIAILHWLFGVAFSISLVISAIQIFIPKLSEQGSYFQKLLFACVFILCLIVAFQLIANAVQGISALGIFGGEDFISAQMPSNNFSTIVLDNLSGVLP